MVSRRPSFSKPRLSIYLTQALLGWRAIAGVVLIIAVVLMGAYMKVRDAESWNATLSVRLPTRAPVGESAEGRRRQQVSTLTDVTKYVNAKGGATNERLWEISWDGNSIVKELG